MNLRTFIELDEEELLEAVNRLRAYQKNHGIEPFLIFECDSIEFSSREDRKEARTLWGTGLRRVASGENFTLLAKKLAFLKEHMELPYMSLSEFCKSCSLIKD